jgi:DNA-binding winged helix-turn-helix (wHTH) protein
VASETDQTPARRAVRFGVYEVDLDARELRKRGVKVSLQEQPFRVLELLITCPGQLLTRDALQRQIWPEETLADSDLGLNTAVKKIRTALGDSAANPRFIETLPKRGYRFIAPVEEIRGAEARVSPVVEYSAPEMVSDEVATTVPHRVNGRRKDLFRVAVLLLTVAIVILVLQTLAQTPRSSAVRNLNSGGAFVYRTGKGSNGLSRGGIGGYTLESPADQAFAFDFDHSGKPDHLVLYRPGVGYIWIVENSGGTFKPVYEGRGIGGYDLKSPRDRVLAFDFDHSGKLDHLALYRSGTQMVWILKNEGAGIFTPVYTHSESAAAVPKGAADQQSPGSQAFAFDYDHSGKQDHLVIYRPEAGSLSILKNSGGTLEQLSSLSVASFGWDPQGPSATSQAFAFDYDHSGKLDHLVLYRPGAGAVLILKNSGGGFSPIYEGRGIGEYDLRSLNDRIFAFDYDHSGKPDHLFLYRPGTGLVSILRNSRGVFTPVYAGTGVGGYDLMSWRDRAFAFDYDRSGKSDHLVFYRPGTGAVSITYFPPRQ